ncbi:uncharacterized protein LOC143613252 [Bidens hawaiensis]|uniref:uncharacterized protein LOC143613252 n=1 Tax=Bidens hawaiensis TaxID=980011 RepID=UPI004049FDAF
MSSQLRTSSVFAPVTSTTPNVNPGSPPIPKKNTQPRGDLLTYSGSSTRVDTAISNNDILFLMKQDMVISSEIAIELQKMKDMISINPGIIRPIAELPSGSHRSFEKLTGDLYRVVQNNDESLRDYITRFSKEALDIPNRDVAAAIEALKMGLKKDSHFYNDFVMTPCRNLNEVRNRALRYIRLEDNSRKNVVEEDENDEEYPKLSEYCFNVDISGVICVMQDLGDMARWPKKNEKSGSGKDKSKWCAYHNEFGHHTNECIALRKEIGYLLSKGYLKELFRKNKNKTRDPAKIPERAASPPPRAKFIAFISGGSDICGTSYSVAKKRARETNIDNEERPLGTSTLTTQRTISFEEEDRYDPQDPHHDNLVITLSIVNCFVRR